MVKPEVLREFLEQYFTLEIPELFFQLMAYEQELDSKMPYEKHGVIMADLAAVFAELEALLDDKTKELTRNDLESSSKKIGEIFQRHGVTADVDPGKFLAASLAVSMASEEGDEEETKDDNED